MLYCCVHAISLSSNMDYCCIVFISTITLPPPSSLSLIWLIVVFMMASFLFLLSRTLSLHSPLVLSLVYCCIGACLAPPLSLLVCVASMLPPSFSLSPVIVEDHFGGSRYPEIQDNPGQSGYPQLSSDALSINYDSLWRCCTLSHHTLSSTIQHYPTLSDSFFSSGKTRMHDICGGWRQRGCRLSIKRGSPLSSEGGCRLSIEMSQPRGRVILSCDLRSKPNLKNKNNARSLARLWTKARRSGTRSGVRSGRKNS